MYLKSLNGIVFDKDQTEIYIFISDILIPKKQQSSEYGDRVVEYLNQIQKLRNLQTILLGSLTPLCQKSIDLGENQGIIWMHLFLRN